MNIFEAIMNMNFTKEFKGDIVDEKAIGLMLHMGTHAPSAGNLQEWEFVVVEEDDKKALLSEAALGVRHLKQAPAVIVVCADLRKAALRYGKRGELLYAPTDIGGCVSYMALAANAMGIGFDIVRSFDEGEVANTLSLPEHIRPIILMPIGYIKGEKKKVNVNPFENVTSVNRFGQKIDIEFSSIFKFLSDYVKDKMAYQRKK